MRIISGRLKNRCLQHGMNTDFHPMGERVRAALFNSLGELVRDAVVLDLFAGTGAVGLEAYSRGATRVDFVEQNSQTARSLQELLRQLQLVDSCRVYRQSTGQFLRHIPYDYDLIFADPPYQYPGSQVQKQLISACTALNPHGLVILSFTQPLDLVGLEIVRTSRYARAQITIYRLADCLSSTQTKNKSF